MTAFGAISNPTVALMFVLISTATANAVSSKSPSHAFDPSAMLSNAIKSPHTALVRSPRGYLRLDSPHSLTHVTSDSEIQAPGALEKTRHVSVPRIPFIRRPLPDVDGPWLKQGHEASAWLSLFYDLAVVAVLTIFSTTHELSTPGSIPTFLSYFVIIAWIWTAQTHYDVRFQAEDALHRFVKGLQIAIFLYIGAASGKWDPMVLLASSSQAPKSGKEAAAKDSAVESFSTVVIAFAVSRALLLAQYVVTAVLSHQVGRSKRTQIIVMASLALSIGCTTASACIDSHTTENVIFKIALLYTTIALEGLGMWLQVVRLPMSHVKTEIVAERYGAFTLIILGEGFIALTRAFNRAISGLSESNTATYGQVFLAILIMYMLFMFLFSDGRTPLVHERAVLWQAVHLPLHFCLLLLLSAMVNTIIVISFAHGINTVTNDFSLSIDNIRNGTALPAVEQDDIRRYFGRLNLEPSYGIEYEYLKELSQLDNPSHDATILGYQYFGQIILQTSLSYGLEISGPVMDDFEDLYEVPTPWTTNATLRDERRQQASDLLVEIIRQPVEEALSGILWLFPCAGAALILSAVRSALLAPRSRVYHLTTHLPMILAGIGVALLGLLDLGSRVINVMQEDELSGTNAMFRLLALKMPLAVVALVYVGVYHIGAAGTWFGRKEGVVEEA